MVGYGSMEASNNGNEEAVQLIVSNGDFDLEKFEIFDKEFWKLVHERYEKKVDELNWKKDAKNRRLWSTSMDEIRAQKIKEKFAASGRDPVVAIMIDWVMMFRRKYRDDEREKRFPSFESQISRIATILIDQECDGKNCPGQDKHKCKYNGLNPYIFTDTDDTKKTLLHIAAEQGLRVMAAELISRFPGLVYVSSRGGSDLSRIPVEYALLRFDDDLSSTIFKSMRCERVRTLFEFNKTEGRCRFRFRDYVNESKMKKTVVAVLESMFSPDWPYVPVENEDDDEREWSNIPDIPIRYHFFYRILDGDDKGRPPTDKNFNINADSCFKLLLASPHQKTIVHHPVVRVLANSKWDNFGCFRIRFFAALYVLYLMVMSTALICGVTATNSTKYESGMDYFRAVCEAVTLFGAVIYFILELEQLISDFKNYFMDVYNYADIIGIVLLFAIVPLRIYELRAQWSVAAIAYLVNFFRVFKYFPAVQFIGLYSKVLAQMLVEDFAKFLIVYLFIMFSFAGSIFLGLKATKGLSNVEGFGDLLLKELRILTEGKEFSDSYSTFNIAVVLLIQINMLMVVVMLINMLIAQLSYRCETAQENAELQYDIDKSLMVAKLEQSRFNRHKLRTHFYKDGDFITSKSDINEIILGWEKIKAQLKSESLPGLLERETALAASKEDQFTGVVKV